MSDDATKAPATDSPPVADEVTELLRRFDPEITDEVIAAIKRRGGKTRERLGRLTEAHFVAAGWEDVIAISDLRAELNPTTEMRATATTGQLSLLPNPGDDTWTNTLVVRAKLDKEELEAVIWAIRAGVADRVGFFKAVNAIKDAVLDYSRTSTRRWTTADKEAFLILLEQLSQEDFALVYRGIKVHPMVVSPAERKIFLNEFGMHVWPAVGSFWRVLERWHQQWIETGGATNAQMVKIASHLTGTAENSGAFVPQFDAVVTQSEAIAKSVRTMVNGPRDILVEALRLQADHIRETLQNERLPYLTGHNGERDQMLDQLGLSVTVAAADVEAKLAQIVYTALLLPNLVPTWSRNETGERLVALYQLGASVPWLKEL